MKPTTCEDGCPNPTPPPIKITSDIESFHPVDGDFYLISVNGRLFGKAYRLDDARMIAAAHDMHGVLSEIREQLNRDGSIRLDTEPDLARRIARALDRVKH